MPNGREEGLLLSTTAQVAGCVDFTDREKDGGVEIVSVSSGLRLARSDESSFM